MRKAVVSPGAVVKANNDLITLANSIGRTVNGNKCATGASSGQFVVLLNSTISGRADGLYTASKAIPANTAIDSSYLTVADEGGLNALNSKIVKSYTTGALTTDQYGLVGLGDIGNLELLNAITADASTYYCHVFKYQGVWHVQVMNSLTNAPVQNTSVSITYYYVDI